MQIEDQKLAEKCQNLQQNSKQALEWLENNKESIGKEYDSIHTELRRSIRSFHKCHIAAKRKMCVGVFGPSQSGKSYLISTLAKDNEGKLFADFAGEQRNFISEINPPGGKESTGLVTRFTTTPPPHLPEGYPIRLRLFSECDIVRVLANTYYADCEHQEAPDQDALLQDLQNIEALYNPQRTAEVNIDDVEELREYMQRNFAAPPRAQLLQRAYWHKAMFLAPGLDLHGRAKLFSLIWDKIEDFTNLFIRLSESLQKLGNPDEAYCTIEALIPRTHSIIDVKILQDLDSTTTDDTLQILGKNGQSATLSRAIVTALTAELTIYMREKPDDFFDHTDLLDFPGYRSRLKLDDIRKNLEREGALAKLFLRGKVAYLFERYCTEKELTSMLLCIGPGNQNVQELPKAIQHWIAGTHGETPERRALSCAETGSALFFILSKMDMEFEEKDGAPSVEERWSTRIEASLLEFFGKNDDWPTNWDGKKAFDNIFLLRNPNVKAKALFDFHEDKEASIRQDQVQYVEKIRDAFYTSSLVQTHVANPREKWEAAMTLNDGGISLLRASLRPLCNPALKRNQIAVTLAQTLEKVTSILQPHFKSDDKEEERKRKEKLSKRLAKLLAGIIELQRFGEFLRHLQVHDHDLYTLYFQAEQERLEQEELAHSIIGPRVTANGLLQGELGDLDFDDEDEDTPSSSAVDEENTIHKSSVHQDEAERFTDIVIRHWIEQMHAFAANSAAHSYFSMPEKELGLFIHELVNTLNRLGITQKMTKAQRNVSGYGNLARQGLVWKQVSLAAESINAFINWLGLDPRYADTAARTVVVQGKSMVVFTPPSEQSNAAMFTEEAKAYDKSYYGDWIRTFMYAVVTNVDFNDGTQLNREENTKLGNILTSFQTQALG